jgi:SAM-dependent methyltransferase
VPRLTQLPPFLAGLPHTVLRGRGGGFAFDGERLPYFYDRYNLTWLNERAVEVPLARRALRRDGSVLEVGNVLAHYGHRGHEVVDKYERAPGVRNMDVLDLDPDRRWDVVISISTVEHVGVDDEPRDPRRGIDAVRLLARAVAPGGELLISVPVGYNPVLDRALLAGEVAGVRVDGLLHTARGPHWRQVPADEAAAAGYDYAEKTARGLLIVRGPAS